MQSRLTGETGRKQEKQEDKEQKRSLHPQHGMAVNDDGSLFLSGLIWLFRQLWFLLSAKYDRWTSCKAQNNIPRHFQQ